MLSMYYSKTSAETTYAYLSTGLLCARVSFHSNQLLQTRICNWQHDDRTSVCAASHISSPRLDIQRDSSHCLASSQLP